MAIVQSSMSLQFPQTTPSLEVRTKDSYSRNAIVTGKSETFIPTNV